MANNTQHMGELLQGNSVSEGMYLELVFSVEMPIMIGISGAENQGWGWLTLVYLVYSLVHISLCLNLMTIV